MGRAMRRRAAERDWRSPTWSIALGAAGAQSTRRQAAAQTRREPRREDGSPQGAVGLQSGTERQRGGDPDVVFDTIGAGDSFNAGYLLGRLNGYDLDDSLECGVQCGSGDHRAIPATTDQGGRACASDRIARSSRGACSR